MYDQSRINSSDMQFTCRWPSVGSVSVTFSHAFLLKLFAEGIRGRCKCYLWNFWRGRRLFLCSKNGNRWEEGGYTE